MFPQKTCGLDCVLKINQSNAFSSSKELTDKLNLSDFEKVSANCSNLFLRFLHAVSKSLLENFTLLSRLRCRLNICSYIG